MSNTIMPVKYLMHTRLQMNLILENQSMASANLNMPD